MSKKNKSKKNGKDRKKGGHTPAGKAVGRPTQIQAMIDRLSAEAPAAASLTPEGFLRELGVWRSTPEEAYAPDFYEEVAEAGGDPSAREDYGYMSPQAGDMNSASERVAERFHSGEYGRLLDLLHSFDRIKGYPAAPRRAADLGGGPGIMSLYLASRHPGCRFTVYDHSPGRTRLGRKWATDRGLGNVEFVEATYRQLAAAPRADNDLVLFFHGMDTDVTGPGPTAEEQAGLDALAGLLAPGGVGVISGMLPLGRTQVQFEAIRRAGLGVDWRFTRCVLGRNHRGEVGITQNYVFVRRGVPHLGKDSGGDWMAHATSAKFPDGPAPLGPQLPDNLAERFRGAEVLMAAGGGPAGEAAAVRLLEARGCLLLEITLAGGERNHFLHTLAGVTELMDLFIQGLALAFPGWQEGDPIDATRNEVHPRLERYLSFWANGGEVSAQG